MDSLAAGPGRFGFLPAGVAGFVRAAETFLYCSGTPAQALTAAAPEGLDLDSHRSPRHRSGRGLAPGAKLAAATAGGAAAPPRRRKTGRRPANGGKRVLDCSG